jgi:hypothetical protein
MFDSQLWENTRPQFILEPLHTRRLLSVDLPGDGASGDEDLVSICLLPAGDFESDPALQEPVSDGIYEIAGGEELMFYTMMMLEGENLEDVPADDQSMLEEPLIEEALPEEWAYLTMVPDDGTEVSLDGDMIEQVPEEWLYMTGGDVVNLGGEFVVSGTPDEVLQTSGDITHVEAAPPPKAATFARAEARPGLAASILNPIDRDLLAGPEGVLV